MVTVVLGERQVKRALDQMKVSIQNRITRSAQRTALAGLAKEIKAKLPGKYKEARKGIGHSLKKNLAGVHVGKAGVAVGIRGARRTRLLEKLKEQRIQREKEGKKGVGIGFNNIQWFIMGTIRRKLKYGSKKGPPAGHRTGRMKYDPLIRNVVARTWASNQSQFTRTMQTRMSQLVTREAAKVRAKGLRK